MTEWESEEDTINDSDPESGGTPRRLVLALVGGGVLLVGGAVGLIVGICSRKGGK